MTLMHLCLVVMMADMNYLSNKILKQKLKSLHKTVEASVWIHNPKQHFQTEFGVVVRRILGMGCASIHVEPALTARKGCAEHPAHISG